jgi:archaellum component FlaF (FlaF/FlaG flagellin family)
MIMLYAIIIASIVLAGLLIKSLQVANQVLISASLNKREEVSIDGVLIDNSSNIPRAQVNITNTGNTLIYDFEHCDLIMSYTSSGRLQVLRERYSSTKTNESGYWYIDEIVVNGGYVVSHNGSKGLEPSETAVLEVNLPNLPDKGSLVIVIFATPGGSRSYYEFYYQG